MDPARCSEMSATGKSSSIRAPPFSGSAMSEGTGQCSTPACPCGRPGNTAGPSRDVRAYRRFQPQGRTMQGGCRGRGRAEVEDGGPLGEPVDAIETGTRTVGEVARMAGVTVRTLHHYDEVGLLRPSARSRSGYRGYDAGDLARLQQVLAYRELGFGLEEVARAARRRGRPGRAPAPAARAGHASGSSGCTGCSDHPGQDDGGTHDGHPADPAGDARGLRRARPDRVRARRRSERWGDTDAYRHRSPGPRRTARTTGCGSRPRPSRSTRGSPRPWRRV